MSLKKKLAEIDRLVANQPPTPQRNELQEIIDDLDAGSHTLTLEHNAVKTAKMTANAAEVEKTAVRRGIRRSSCIRTACADVAVTWPRDGAASGGR